MCYWRPTSHVFSAHMMSRFPCKTLLEYVLFPSFIKKNYKYRLYDGLNKNYMIVHLKKEKYVFAIVSSICCIRCFEMLNVPSFKNYLINSFFKVVKLHPVLYQAFRLLYHIKLKTKIICTEKFRNNSDAKGYNIW